MTSDEFFAEFDKQTAEYEKKLDEAYQRGRDAIIKKFDRRIRFIQILYGVLGVLFLALLLYLGGC